MKGNRRGTAGKSPGSIASRFKPGNHYGQMAGVGRVMELKRIMLSEIGEDGLREVVKIVMREALAGKEWACREVLDRLLGKSVQHVEVEATPVTDAMTEMELLEFLVSKRFPDYLWPSMLLVRYRNGMLKLPEAAKVVEAKEVKP